MYTTYFEDELHSYEPMTEHKFKENFTVKSTHKTLLIKLYYDSYGIHIDCIGKNIKPRVKVAGEIENINALFKKMPNNKSC